MNKSQYLISSAKKFFVRMHYFDEVEDFKISTQNSTMFHINFQR